MCVQSTSRNVEWVCIETTPSYFNIVQLSKHHVNFSHFLGMQMQIFNLTTFKTCEHYLSISLVRFSCFFPCFRFPFAWFLLHFCVGKDYIHLIGPKIPVFIIFKRLVILDGITHFCIVHTRLLHHQLHVYSRLSWIIAPCSASKIRLVSICVCVQCIPLIEALKTENQGIAWVCMCTSIVFRARFYGLRMCYLIHTLARTHTCVCMPVYEYNTFVANVSRSHTIIHL